MKTKRFLCATILLLCMTAAFSQKSYIIDRGNFLSENEIAQLNDLAQSVKDEFGYNVCIVLVENYGGMEADDFAEATYKKQFGNADGILFAYGANEAYVFLHRTGIAAQQIFFESGTRDELLYEFYSGDVNYEKVEAYINKARTFFASYFDQGEYSVPILKTHDQVVDLGNLLSASAKRKLETKLDEIVARQNFDVVVLTVDSLNGLTRQAFADDFYDYNHYGIDKNGNGYGEERDGVLLLVKMTGGAGKRDIHISTRGYGIKAFTDDGWNWIIDMLIPKLKDGEYAEAFDDFANYADDFVTQARTGRSYKGKFMPVREPFGFFYHIATIMIGFILGAILDKIYVAKNKKALESVALGKTAADYEKNGSMRLVDRSERFLYETKTKVYSPRSTYSGGGGGGSSTHTSSSGATHGGGGRSF